MVLEDQELKATWEKWDSQVGLNVVFPSTKTTPDFHRHKC